MGAGSATDYPGGCGAMGMAFTDALIDHADVHVTLVDQPAGPGGALGTTPTRSCSSTRRRSSTASRRPHEAGHRRRPDRGPETGLRERAQAGSEILAY